MTYRWTGRVVSVNKWHVVRHGRIYASKEYETFVKDLAWTFASQLRQLTPGRVDVTVAPTLRPRVDKQNILKPTLDALKRAIIVPDDNDQLGHIHILPAKRVGRRDVEEILVFVRKAVDNMTNYPEIAG